MAAPRRPSRGEVREQGEVREADRVPAAAALRPQVEADRDRDQEQAEEQLGGEEVHAGRPVRSGVRAKPWASAGSQGPSVESRRWRTPSRRNSARERGAVGRGGLVEARREAGGRRCRRGASARSRDRPASARRRRRATSSRGSPTSTAMTACRPATSVSGAIQSRGPRKSDTMTTTPRVRPRGADERERASGRGLAAALLGRFGGDRAKKAEHPAAAAGGWRHASRDRSRTSRSRAGCRGAPRSDRRRARRPRPRRPCAGRPSRSASTGSGRAAARRSAAGPARPRGPAGRASGRWRSSRSRRTSSPGSYGRMRSSSSPVPWPMPR